MTPRPSPPLLIIRTTPNNLLLALTRALVPCSIRPRRPISPSRQIDIRSRTHQLLDFRRRFRRRCRDARDGRRRRGSRSFVVGDVHLGDDFDVLRFEDVGVGFGGGQIAAVGDGATHCAGANGGPVPDCAAGRGRFGVGGAAEGAIFEFVALMGVAAGAHPAGAFGEAGFTEAHELVEDGEFEFEFDGVDHGFDAGLGGVFFAEFEADENDVHADTDQIDQDELEHHFPGHAVVDGAQDADRRDDVEG